MTAFLNTTPQPMPQVGNIYYDIVSNTMRLYDGSQWNIISPTTVEELLWTMCVRITLEKEQGIYER